jgi:competence protein ComEA
MKAFLHYLCLLVALGLPCNGWALTDVNTADEGQLRHVKGIGEVRARAIIAWRTKNGPFRSINDLRRVKGFGDKTLTKVAPALSISGRPATPTQNPKPIVIKSKDDQNH